jgi:ParB-like chromosome segregation protein Spo0J
MSVPTYQFHPLAARFRLLEGDEFKRLVEDIRGRGLIEPIVLHEGMILDGRNRYRACLEAGVPPRFKQYVGGNAKAFVISTNFMRRHLSPDERRELVTEILADDPEVSDRKIGETLGLDHKTVASIRRKGEEVGKIPHTETRRDKEGHQRPAHQPERPQPEARQPPHPQPSAEVRAAADLINLVRTFVLEWDEIDTPLALRGLSASQRPGLEENVRRALARLEAINSLLKTAVPAAPGKPAPLECCATCGAAGVDLFGYREPGGGMTWFCAEHRKAKLYADTHRTPEQQNQGGKS